MKSFFTLIALLFCVCAIGFGQTETFDLATYTPPKGWKKEQKDFAVSYSTVNQQKGIWCQVAVYQSINGSGHAVNDFNSEWKSIVVKNYQPSTTPVPESVNEDGWTACSGASTFQWQGKETIVLLTTIEGYGKLMSITVLMNSQDYMNDIEAFLNSVNLKKPDVQQPVNTEVVNNNTKVNQTAGTVVVTGSPGKHGISISTTNFDDGWVAQPFADYCRVTKGGITVLLHYGFTITDELRNSNNMEGVIFDQYILPRYTISNLKQFQNEPYTYNKVYFYEADAVEKSTGKRCHIGFRMIPVSGVEHCIEIISPSADDFYKTFPKQENVEAMQNYNKFAVTAADLIGKWEESTFAGVDMYNVSTGAYAGMNTSSSANSFVFNADNTYSSNHKGAFGMVGSMQFYDQKYKGKMTVTNWDLTLTNRWEGKTDVFWAQFEAVRGGKILHLRDKSASGITYHLVKVN